MTIREHIAFRNIFFLDTCDDVQSIGVDKEGRLISIESSEGRDYQRIFAVVEASISATERMLPIHSKVECNRAKLRELASPPAVALEVGAEVSAGAGASSCRAPEKEGLVDAASAESVIFKTLKREIFDLFDNETTCYFEDAIANFLLKHTPGERRKFLEGLDAICGGPFFSEEDALEQLERIAKICFSDSEETKLKFHIIQELKGIFDRRSLSAEQFEDFFFRLHKNLDMVDSCAVCFLGDMEELKKCANLLARIKDREANAVADVFSLVYETIKKSEDLVAFFEKMIPILEASDEEPSTLVEKLLIDYQGGKRPRN